MNKLSIRFCIPIYLISLTSEKYIITEKSFKYYKYLQNLFKDVADLTFTIVGSENDLSKQLVLKYFDEDSYLEYSQGDVNYFNRRDLNTVVGNKIKCAYNTCKKYNPDLIIFIKNNHFISEEWLRYIINDYDENNFKVYGFPFESNIFILTTMLTNGTISDNEIYFIDHRDKQPCKNIEACVIGFPRKVYSIYEMGNSNQTEVTIKNELLKLGVDINFSAEHFHIFNIKSKDPSTNVTDFTWIIHNYPCKKYTLSQLEEIKDFYQIVRDIKLLNLL